MANTISKPTPAPENQTPKTVSDSKKVHGVVAEFSDVESLLAACRRVRDAGYTRADAFTPFPVHGIDTALGIKPTVLPWISLVAGLSGTAIALLMQISMNGDWIEGFSYPYIISGKPFVSLPAFIPVTFELTILLASFGTFFGMWALNGLPRFSNPMFTSPRFDRATDDTFFLFLDAKDSRFDEAGAKTLLDDLGGEFIVPVVEDDSPSVIPKGLLVGLAVIIALSLIPALVVARMRVTKSASPRFHIFPDMDFSPAKDAQQTSTLFADGRAMRPDVPGTVHRGELDWDLDFQTGIDMEKLARIDMPRAIRLVAMMQSDVEVTDEQVAEAVRAVEEQVRAEAELKTAEPAGTKSELKEKTKEKQSPNESKPTVEKPMPKSDESEPETAAMKPSEAGKSEAKPSEAKPQKAEPSPKQVDKAKTLTPEVAETKADMPKAEMSETAEQKGSPDSLAPATGQIVDNTPWLTDNPLPMTAEVLARGQQQFNIYCSVCHGMNGRGNGLVNQRAQAILSTTWTPPSNLHDQTLYEDAYPNGKLFGTISNGIRKMPGYSSQIKTKDRWAVVAYVRALQASRNASIDDVPASRRKSIEKLQAEVQAKLEAAKEAEAKAAAEKKG